MQKNTHTLKIFFKGREKITSSPWATGAHKVDTGLIVSKELGKPAWKTMVGGYMALPTLLERKALEETLKMKLGASSAAVHPHFLSLSFWSLSSWPHFL